MLANRKISITAVTVIENEEIAKHGAAIDIETGDISFYCTRTNEAKCKMYREAVRADQAEFEDFAYGIQEEVMPKEQHFDFEE